MGQKAEEAKVAVRNVRRDTNASIEKMEKRSEISEDEAEAGKKEVQELTDDFTKQVEKAAEVKVEEVMEV